ncbi:MAG: hypothetical protein CVU35_03750 [Betaproteobacteria bacterium HGW-Betaproteobacteria-8]|nr:MAG: hypothetical protein CVU35_03750 [Betaproteobacteria bacterium HGW-Betaproteobacteria-8]
MRQCVATAPVSIRTSFFRSCFICLSSLVLLLVTLLSHSSQAADAPSTEETSTLTWPLLPGENLNQLARLFYPDDGAMQAVFIRQTLTLSRELHPQLQADQRFDQITSIVIPELKALSRHANRPVRKPGPLQMARQMGEESIAIVTEAMWQQYQTLEQNHQQLNSALESLHNRLDRLQRTVQEITDAARKAIQAPAADKPAGAEPANGKAAAPQTLVTTTKIPGTQTVTGNSAFAGILASWRYIAALASLLLFGLLLFWLLRRKRQQIALNNQQFTQWLNTVQPNIAPERTPPKPSLLNETEFETEDALQQARILVGSGKPKSAIELLDRAINAETPQPLETWLYLLDLCREAALRTEFENYAQKLHHHFNVMTPQWEKVEIPLIVASSLEEFPHISEQLVKHWQDGSADAYLQSLLTDNRGGERAGFGPEVMQEILLLQGLLKNRE